jgi:serine/threonine protein kinase
MGGQISILGDIYSCGVLLFEMFTGKRPTDCIFKDGLSIQKFTVMALPELVMDIVTHHQCPLKKMKLMRRQITLT